jgi:predicted dehydrogenase
VRAQALGRRYGFAFCASEPEAVLADELTDCVFILTRHDSHAPLAEAALRAGKHVFVEKPLALTLDELEAVERAQRETGRLLMVGFNRRYAPLAVMLRQFFTPRVQPMVVSYRANVGYRPPQHWLHDPQQGGGVVLGEACHHIDLCGWLVGAPVSGVRARPLGRAAGGLIPEDNVLIEIAYQDGSLASVAYLSNGARAHPAETVEVFAEGKTASLVDFRHLVRARGLWRRSRRLWLRPDKGHAGQVADFLAAVAGHRAAPLDVGLYLASSRATLEAAAQVRAALVATA